MKLSFRQQGVLAGFPLSSVVCSIRALPSILAISSILTVSSILKMSSILTVSSILVAGCSLQQTQTGDATGTVVAVEVAIENGTGREPGADNSLRSQNPEVMQSGPSGFGLSAELVIPPGFDKPTVTTPEPAKSYWMDHVHYPFPVHLAKVSDSQGQAWTLAYVDEYEGDSGKDSVTTVVLIHSRCGSLGYFSQLIKSLAKDVRVIAIDLPNQGKSLPPNLHHAYNLSLNDSREIVHNLLVDHLKLSDFSLLGHSLGGQWALGFALRYPGLVHSLVLASSYGLETYQGEAVSGPLFSSELLGDQEQWEQTWENAGMLKQERSVDTRAIDQLFFHPDTTKLSRPNHTELSKSYFFLERTPDSIFFAEARTQAGLGHLGEFERLIHSCSWNVYASATEVVASNPENLPQQLNNLEVDTFLAFGSRDPFLPNSRLSGNKDLAEDLIKPVLQQINSGRARAVAKVYPYSSHAPHIDQPWIFARDVSRFLLTGKIESF